MTTQVNDDLLTWMEGLLVDRKARGLTNNTLLCYSLKLKQFHSQFEGIQFPKMVDEQGADEVMRTAAGSPE